MSDPKMKKRWPWIVLGCAAGYFLLLLLLVAVESANPDASIQTYSDAIWYSLVTLSTVGYGDLYPVTPFGRVLGFCFVLMSTGLLTFLIGAVASILFSRLLPDLRLYSKRNRNWYIFPNGTEEDIALAANLAQEDPESIALFLNHGQEQPDIPENGLLVSGSLQQLLRHKKNAPGKCILFYLGPDGYSNERDARQALEYGYDVYCQCESEPDTLPEKLHLFNSFSCCARLFWQHFPVGTDENVILIGNGKYAQELLECGLQMNIRSPEQGITYHAFGDWADFCRNHPRLNTAVAVNDAAASGDRVIFHTQPWNHSEELLVSGRLILLCDDSEAENLEVFRQLRHSFPVPGTVCLRSSREIPGAESFGTRQQLFTPEFVMGQKLNRTAMTMHEIYRRGSGNTAPTWEELSEFLRQSNIAAADHLLTKIRLLLQDDSVMDITADICGKAYQVYLAQKEEKSDFFRRIEHLRWVRFHALHNWRYAPVRNNARREHTMILPFEQLSPADQAKDDYAWELLRDLAKEAE